MERLDDRASIAGVCDVRLHGPHPPRLLVEVPHGATRRTDYEATRSRLAGPFPEGLEEFFHVNTDVGAPECAEEIATRVGALVLRSLVPRTFIDCNRIVEPAAGDRIVEGVTPGLPGYVREPHDVELLLGLHAAYQALARRAYDAVCGGGGLALTLHTYAPRSVEIERLDDDIVAALREAYRPERYAKWRIRPDVDLITETADGSVLAPAALVDDLVARYAAIGIRAERNATYRLHPSTQGFSHSRRWPGRVLCVELNRGCLADPFVPFREMTIPAERVRRMSGPLAAALGAALAA